jgi:hypothetical protein
MLELPLNDLDRPVEIDPLLPFEVNGSRRSRCSSNAGPCPAKRAKPTFPFRQKRSASRVRQVAYVLVCNRFSTSSIAGETSVW